jgi:2-C-methyl-D-erythritol 2,4-cyclodiphosphate synthase
VTLRSGVGFDSHRFASGRSLVLGGVRVEHPLGLVGFSDADALTHAVIDALLGAAGLGDIGLHFPDTDERWRDADSIDLLRGVLGMIREAGLAPVHVDATVVCEEPRLGPYREPMRVRLAEALGLEPSAVNVKFTTAEGMGWVGSGEGIATLAIATVAPRRELR